MLIPFTFTDAKKFFTTQDVFELRKATKGMTPDDVFAFLSMKTDETGEIAYFELAKTMVVSISVK